MSENKFYELSFKLLENKNNMIKEEYEKLEKKYQAKVKQCKELELYKKAFSIMAKRYANLVNENCKKIINEKYIELKALELARKELEK